VINSQPLNSGPINGFQSAAVEPPTPAVVIDPGPGFVWRWIATLGGVDVSDKITGQVRIEAQEDGDMIAALDLWLGDDPVSIYSYTGQTLILDFVVLGDPEVVSRRFTGQLVQPEFDVLTRVLSCTGTTRLSGTFEAKEIAEIDQFVGGSWSVDVFEETAGRSRWDYTKERMSTRTAGLSADRFGQPRITPWYSPAIAYEFGPGSTIYQSLDVALASLSEATNTIELEIDYRFPRYRQRNMNYSWTNPLTGGSDGVGGLVNWLDAGSSELPDIEMITEAVQSSGWFLAAADWQRLPGSTTLPDGSAWINKFLDLLLGADFSTAIRWSQRAVERYIVRLEVAASIASVGEVIYRDRIVLDTETDTDRLWEQSGETEITGTVVASGDYPVDTLPRRDQTRLDTAADTGLRRARAQLLSAQRGNIVSWQVPLAHALGVDVGQRQRLSDQGATVTGSVVALTEEADTQTGSALLTISIAVSQGDASAIADVLQLPDAPVFTDDTAPTISGILPTQLIQNSSSPPYDEALPGFSGAYSIGTWNPADRYPRRFAVPTPEIPAQWRDEIVAEQPVIIRIAPPVDELEV
jgi:hypothetical protein